MAQAMTTCPECGARMSAYALPGHMGRAHKKVKPVAKPKGK
jgi:hypothetical protein